MNFRMLAAGIVVALLLECGPRLKAERRQFFRMDMPVQITLVVPSNRSAYPVWTSIDSLLRRYDELFSNSRPASEILRINTRAGDTIAVSPRLGEMLAAALRYADTLNGDFDFTIFPIKELWGLGELSSGNEPPPSDSQVAAALGAVGQDKVRVNDRTDTIFFASPLVRIDAGGVAKGFALRDLARLLDAAGIANYLVAGGDVIARGRRLDGTPWIVGIQHPRRDGLLAKVPLDSGAIFTSGDYERFRMIDGRRIHHIFNPHTGHSCTSNQSVTLWGMDPIALKFFSTGLFCRPAASIIRFVESHGGLEAVVVDSAGAVLMSRGWISKVQMAAEE